MEHRHFDSVAQLARASADVIAEVVARRPRAVIGWPSGRTTAPVIAELAARGVDLSQATIAMMDDYVVEVDGRPANSPDEAHFGCRTWVETTLLPALPADGQPRVLIPSAGDPASHELALDALGGIDLFLVGLGASDGHVAFNPPGSAADSRTRIVDIAESTRVDNLGTFPDFESLDQVPRQGVTVGIATITGARRVLALAHGPAKRDVVDRTLRASGFDPALPSSCLTLNPQTQLFTAELGDAPVEEQS